MCAASPDPGETLMKKLFTLVATIAAVLGLQACNTIEGIGKDVKKAGEVVEDAASKKR
jgi:predicted small secreted protein